MTLNGKRIVVLGGSSGIGQAVAQAAAQEGAALVIASSNRARVDAALRSVGIDDRSRAYPSQLSGGQMQRAAVARAVVHDPAIVLADEPTGNLDSQNGAAVLALLREIADGGQAILMATHSAEAAAVCDRVVYLADGRVTGANSTPHGRSRAV